MDLNQTYVANFLKEGETTYKDIVDRVCKAFKLSVTQEQKEKYLYTNIINFASTIISNAKLKYNRKRNIFNCYMLKPEDDLVDIANCMGMCCLLTGAGGGIGLDLSNLASRKENNNTTGVLSFARAFHNIVIATKQSSKRRGNVTMYLDIEHDEIEEFIGMHNVKQGGDDSLKIKDSFPAVKISDEFMKKLKTDKKAQELIKKIATLRFETGKPYIVFSGNSNKNKSEAYKDIDVSFSNLCTEIFLDVKKGKASVCCLSSINFKPYMELPEEERIEVCKLAPKMLHEILKFVAKEEEKNKVALSQIYIDGSVGVGVFGYTDYTESLGKDFDHPDCTADLFKMFDMLNKYGIADGLKQVTAIAPTEITSRVCDASQGVDYYPSREFVQKDSHGVNMRNIEHHNKFAFDIEQSRKIAFIADLQKHIHQGISCNLFYKTDAKLETLVRDICLAHKLGVKSLYYSKIPPAMKSNSPLERNIKYNATPADIPELLSSKNDMVDYSDNGPNNGGSCCGN